MLMRCLLNRVRGRLPCYLVPGFASAGRPVAAAGTGRVRTGPQRRCMMPAVSLSASHPHGIGGLARRCRTVTARTPQDGARTTAHEHTANAGFTAALERAAAVAARGGRRLAGGLGDTASTRGPGARACH